MFQNGQTHFKNLAAFAASFLSVFDHFGTLYIKGLMNIRYYHYIITKIYGWSIHWLSTCH